MRLLHTSDWHVGRSLHGTDLLVEQEEVLSGLARVVREEAVDVVLVAGDVYDRAVPSADAVGVLGRVLSRLHAAGAVVVLTPGNHDSARRLGFAADLLALSGVHVRATTAALDEPLLLEDRHGEVAIYGLPFLEPETARHELEVDVPRSHQAVVSAAMDRVRADLDRRPGARSVVLAHAFVAGGIPSDSERDIAVGGVDRVAESAFDGVDYVALGHLHRAQSRSARMRYSGSPLPYSFGEAGQRKLVWLVDLDADGLADVRSCDLEVPRALTVLTGELADLVTNPAHDGAESHFVSVELIDAIRPVDPMRRLRARFPHCVHLVWNGPAGGAAQAGYLERTRGRDAVAVAEDFVRHVREVPATPAERELLRRALAEAVARERDR